MGPSNPTLARRTRKNVALSFLNRCFGDATVRFGFAPKFELWRAVDLMGRPFLRRSCPRDFFTRQISLARWKRPILWLRSRLWNLGLMSFAGTLRNGGWWLMEEVTNL